MMEGDKSDSKPELTKEDEVAISAYFKPIFEKYRALGNGEKMEKVDFKMNPTLLENLCLFTWGPDIFKSSPGVLKRIYSDLNHLFNVTDKQSDLKDLLQYYPSQAFAAKFSQVVVAMALVDPELVKLEFKEVDKLWLEFLAQNEGQIETGTEEAIHFLRQVLKNFFEVLSRGSSGGGEDGNAEMLDYKTLSDKAKLTIKGYSVAFLKLFRTKSKERIERMKLVHQSDPASVEWTLTLDEMLRLKRREFKSYSKKPSAEEWGLVLELLQMEPNNPHVRINIIDCIVDAVREQNGRFECGEICLRNMEEAMRFLRKECNSLLGDFPNNVYFSSMISDYFSRSVPLLYFDGKYAKELLLTAYELNPKCSKTTHRLGIVCRTNEGDFQESLKWQKKTLELDPFHFNGNMDYFKTLLGTAKTLQDFETIIADMQEKLSSGGDELWRYSELAEFKFHLGLAYFACNKKNDALTTFVGMIHHNESLFTLSDADRDASFFKWNDGFLNTEAFRAWIMDEHQKQQPEYELYKPAIKRMFLIMFGFTHPKAPLEYFGPYSAGFTKGLRTELKRLNPTILDP